MAHYIIGDVQGCFDAFKGLLKAIDFNEAQDRITFCGDLVNRGGQSLKMLRWVYAHQHCCDSVLGNHDLSLLARYHCPEKRGNNKEFEKIFKAKDCQVLMDWLIQRPLLFEYETCWVVHAGFYPSWNPQKWHKHANRVSKSMQKDPQLFFKNMFGNYPLRWSEVTDKVEKVRFIVNAMTRMRFLKSSGSGLNLDESGTLRQNTKLMPWFRHPRIAKVGKKIVFGHWSALGLYQDNHVICLDTGKVWGGLLTALRLDDGILFQV
ncbi:symmetrical bis(5'-nucleosyl)-tetraphosphatase [Marinicella rhabdoformis]|uniref:symmetrical bis(5'-nucleosyl)-tetraphosphatase n=1 Tax=Marinicella rhabdoformis TaxID=2580566 RepID=UPI0012AEC02A